MPSTLPIDTMETVTVPGNGISLSGIRAIKRYLSAEYLPPLPDNWDWDWRIGGRGEYVGTFPKRVGKYYHQVHKCKLSDSIRANIGNLARDNCNPGKTEIWYLSFSHAIGDWDRGQFGDPESCFWTCHKSAIAMLEENGALSLKAYHSDYLHNSNGRARAWLIPYDNCWLLINGYIDEHSDATLQLSRVLATYLQHAYYRRVKVCNNGIDDGDLWINSGRGYLIGAQEDVIQTEHIDLQWPDIMCIPCARCGGSLQEEDVYSVGDYSYCEHCYGDLFFECSQCTNIVSVDDMHETIGGAYICDDCARQYYTKCDNCYNYILDKNVIFADDGGEYCESCYDAIYYRCEKCGGEYLHNAVLGGICQECYRAAQDAQETGVAI